MGWLREKRTKKRLTQRQVAQKAGIGRTVYVKIETGARLPTVANAMKIAKVLGFSKSWTRFYDVLKEG